MEENQANDFLSEALDIPRFCETVKGVMERYDVFLGKNAILVIMTCLDDQCTTIIEQIKRELRKFHPSKYTDHEVIHMEKFYGMRLFGGIFIPHVKTYESLLPAAHHIPDKQNGKLLIMNFSHIGYDTDKNEFGSLIRYSHASSTHACGAITSSFDRIKNNKTMPKDTDLKALYKYLKNIVKTNGIQSSPHGYDILDLTIKAYEGQIIWLKQQFLELTHNENIDIVYLGGIEIDMTKTREDHEDKIVILDKFVIEKNATITNF